MGNSHGKLSIRKKGPLQRPSFFSGRGDAEKVDATPNDDDGKSDVAVKALRRGKREKRTLAVSSSGAEGTVTLDELLGETVGHNNGDSEDTTNTKPPAQDAPTTDAPDVEPDLTAVIPYALPMLPSKQAVKYFTTCRAWGATGDEVLPTLLKRELRSVLPPRLVWMLNKSENSREHWTEFARQWFRKEFVRAKVGNSKDDTNIDECDENKPSIGTTEPPCCSACGETSADLKRCKGCSSVWYCNVACQRAHRKSHKKECKEISNRHVAEEDAKKSKAIEPLMSELDLMETFLTRPDIADCLADTTSPREFEMFLYSLGCESFHNLAAGLGGGKLLTDEFEEPEKVEDWQNYSMLVELDETHHIRKEKFAYFVDEVRKSAPGLDHYYMLEIMGKGGKKLTLEDGTPLAIWTDGLGRQDVGPELSEYAYREKNSDLIDEHFVPKCSCPDCGAKMDQYVIFPDNGPIKSGLLLDEPWLGTKMCGYEKKSYGRTIIKEGDLPDLSFADTYETLAMEASGEIDGSCVYPDSDSMEDLFEVTLKLVHYDGLNSPSVVVLYDRQKLRLASIRDEERAEDEDFDDDDDDDEPRPTGAVRMTFQDRLQRDMPDGNGANSRALLGIELNVKNVALLSSQVIDRCKFECDPRPDSNQMWLMDWNSFCYITTYDEDEGHYRGMRLPRAELFRACGLLSGFD